MHKHGFDDWAMWTGFETGVPASKERYQDPYINTPEGSKTYKGEFGPDVYANRLIDFMKLNRDNPMCIYFPMALPHTPFVSTPDEPNVSSKIDKHKAMVRYVDKLVGRLVGTLDELGIRERTLVFVTTDNGTVKTIKGTRSGNVVKGGKGGMLEAGVCAPFIVNAPGLVPSGVETDALTDLTDMLPTFLELAGASAPEDLVLDGVSIAPLILGEKNDSEREWVMALGGREAIVDDHGIRPLVDFAPRIIRDKQYKVWVSEDKDITQLYDLESDPWEKTNLIASQSPEHLAALKKMGDVVATLPEKDARPRYQPRAENAWDRKMKR